MVITVEIYKQIRKMRLDGISQRQIAAALHISRNTVKKYWDGDSVPWERKDYSREASVLTDDVVAFVRQCLDEDAHSPRKQHHTAKRIYERLVAECGFSGGETTVRRLVRELREKPQEAFVPLAFPAGDAMQIDWGEATVYLNGMKTTVNLFCARLCYSGAPMVLAYRRQNEESFLDALVRVFQYFGGVPRRVIFDNGKVAVKDGFGAHARKQAGYAALAAHYGFEPVFCNPASGNEKGLVENLVGYIRRNVCVPLPRVKSLDELNAKLLAKCTQYLNHQIEGRPDKVGVMLNEDQAALQPMPRYTPDISKKVYPTVGRYSTVLFETNHYSVPCKYRGKATTVKAYPNHIEVWIEGTMVARHDRLFGRKEESLDLQHYLPILAQKGRAIRYARPVQNAVPAQFIDWLECQELTAKEIVEMLTRCLEVGYIAVMAGIVSAKEQPAIQDAVTVPPVDLEAYDSLYGKGAAVS